MKKKRIAIIALAVVLLGACAALGAVLVYSHMGLRAAEDLLAHELWPQARERLHDYVWLHPDNDRANLLLAEAYAKDEKLPPKEGATQAIIYLDRIPDSSADAARARLQQAGLYLLVLHQPGRAEKHARKAIDLGGGLLAYQFLWQLLNLTGRAEDSEDVFWRVYELAPDDEKRFHLIEWYVQQFFPTTANEGVDRMMGVVRPDEAPSRTTESGRYIRFREQEPDSVIGHTALAEWCQEEGDPDFAIRLLDTAKDLPEAKSDPYFLSVSIATCLDLGEFNRAEECFDRWPESNRSHSYWKWRANIFDEVRANNAEALSAYDHALALWPGPADWGLYHRQAACLTRAKKPEEAARAVARADELKQILRSEELDRLLVIVKTSNKPEELVEIAGFYRKLGRGREAACWEKVIKLAETPVSKSP